MLLVQIWHTLRNSRVVEVADTFIGKTNEQLTPSAPRYEGRVTLEEILDSLFQNTPYPEEPTDPRHVLVYQCMYPYQCT